jgi:serralysin
VATPTAPIDGTAAGNTLNGTGGANTINGLAGNDRIYGKAGSDRLHGGTGNDKLYGDAGNDRLYGDSGKDILNGGSGNDILTGGTNADTFRFSGKWGKDKIVDFKNASDHIDLRGNGLSFDKLSIGAYNGDSDGKADDVLIKAGSQSITLLNVKLALIGASDFLF